VVPEEANTDAPTQSTEAGSSVTPLPDIDEIKSLVEQCDFSKIKIHQFLPGSSFMGLAAYKG